MSACRRVLAAVLATCCLFAFSSCEKEVAVEEYVPYDYDLASYINIKSVLRMKYTPVSTAVTEEEIEYRIIRLIRNAGLYETDFANLVIPSPEDEARLGDRVTFSSSATVDGENYAPAFAENKTVVLGENKVLIRGFEENVVGMKKDETKTFTLKLPSDYSEFKLRNKEIIFTVTVKSISDRYLCPETLSKEQVDKIGKYSDFSELYTETRDTLTAEKEAYAEDRKIADCFTEAVNNVTVVAYPQVEIEKYIEEYLKFVEMQAKEDGYKDLDDYIRKTGITKEMLTSQGMEYARGDILQEMLVYYVARAEGFDKMSDEMFEKFASPYVAEYGLSSVDQLVEVVGYNEVQKKVLTFVVKQYIADNAVAQTEEAPEAE